jgi:two-component system capsular synthesis sensor histidine kinase RcsC
MVCRHAVPALDEAGHLEGHLLTLRDITIPKENELQLLREKQLVEEARIAADEANQAKRVFLTNMSHEMRTPLMAISGYLELLSAEPLPPQQRQHAREIGVASEALLTLVNEMLDLSRIEAGRMTLERVPFRVDALVEECASLMAVRLRDRPVDLVFETSVSTPLVVGDRGRVRQMILNLVGNAVKFTENGSIRLVLREAAPSEIPGTTGDASPQLAETPASPAAGDTRWIALEVRDTGPGIAEEVQPRLFEPFVQANADISRRYGGSGLGLAITARIAQAMGGVVLLESWPGLGSAFTLVLPFPILSLAGRACARFWGSVCWFIRGSCARWRRHGCRWMTGRRT